MISPNLNAASNLGLVTSDEHVLNTHKAVQLQSNVPASVASLHPLGKTGWRDEIKSGIDPLIPDLPSGTFTDDVSWDDIRDHIILYPFTVYYTQIYCKCIENIGYESKAEINRLSFVNDSKSWMQWELGDALTNIPIIEDRLASLVAGIPHDDKQWSQVLETAMRWDHEDLSKVLSTAKNQKVLLGLKETVLQGVVDLLDQLSDGTPKYCNVLKGIVNKLIKRRGLLPRNFLLEGVKRESEHVVGGGGFADVYLGDFCGEQVALKVLRMFSHTEMENKAFCKEAVVWRRLNHPNVLPFYGVCEEIFSPRLAFVSPWMEHGHLLKYLKDNPGADRMKLIYGMTRGLAYLHQSNIIHGDFRSPNVLVDKRGQARIADFGLARVIDSTSRATLATAPTSSPGHHGAVRWLAPELIFPEYASMGTFTFKTDVYAYGCVIVEIFTGKAPFYELLRDAAVVFAVAIENRRPKSPPASATEYGFTVNLWNLVQACWSTKASDRLDMKDVLDRLLAYRRQEDGDITAASGSCEDTSPTPSVDPLTYGTGLSTLWTEQNSHDDLYSCMNDVSEDSTSSAGNLSDKEDEIIRINVIQASYDSSQHKQLGASFDGPLPPSTSSSDPCDDFGPMNAENNEAYWRPQFVYNNSQYNDGSLLPIATSNVQSTGTTKRKEVYTLGHQSSQRSGTVSVVKRGRNFESIAAAWTSTRSETGADLSLDLSPFRPPWHLIFAEFLGDDSRSWGGDTEDLSELHRGESISLQEYLLSLPTSRRLDDVLRVGLEAYDALDYLSYNKLSALTSIEHLMVNRHDGHLLLDVGKDTDSLELVWKGQYVELLRQLRALFRKLVQNLTMTFEETIRLWTASRSTCLRGSDAFSHEGSFNSLYVYAGINTVVDELEQTWLSVESMELVDPEIQPSSLVLPLEIYLVEGNQTVGGSPLLGGSSHNITTACPQYQNERFYLRSIDYAAETDSKLAQNYIGRHGIALSKQHGVELNDIYIVFNKTFVFEAFLDYGSNKNLQPIYFHMCPLENSQPPMPWGYFSFQSRPSSDSKHIAGLMTRTNKPIKGACYRFKSKLHGVNAMVYVRVNCDYVHLSPPQANLLSYIHGIFNHAEDIESSARIAEMYLE